MIGSTAQTCERLRASEISPRRLGGITLRYKFIVTYGVFNLVTFTTRFYIQDFIFPAFKLLLLIDGVNWYIDKTHLGYEVAQVKDLVIEVIR